MYKHISRNHDSPQTTCKYMYVTPSHKIPDNLTNAKAEKRLKDIDTLCSAANIST